MTYQPLDHGYLNLPLRQRGDIDKQIDAYKAQQAREAKAKRQAARALVKEARALVRQMTDVQLALLGKPHGLTIARTRKMMLAAAESRPAAVIAANTRKAD